MDVDPKIYREQVDEAVMFLRGRTSDLMRKLKAEMQQASQAQEYERAARLRDKIFSLQRTIEKQIAVTTDFKDRDVFAVAGSDKLSVITLLVVRGGFIKGTRHFNFAETMASDEEILGTFMRQYYQKTAFVPAEILVTRPLPDGDLMEDWFRAVKQTRVKINWPRRGEKARLTAMAAQNAAKELEEIRAIQNADMQLLIRLQRRLRLERLPQRIECIDNSNISGVHAVASLVVFEGGKAKKSAYRKYRIKTVHEHDDYAYMSEVLTRRLETKDASEPDVYPDLLMVDGGKGQLNIAVSVLKELQLEGVFEIIAIAKKDEKKGEHQDKIFIPGRANPVIFGREGDLLLFLQKIRDEAHRFAITYHRQRRTKMGLQSVLDTIPGIGSKRKAALLKHFKSIAGIRAASLQDISSLPGFNRKVAENVLQALRVEEKNV
jgi:excinuclease ABC subunit C